MFFLIIVLLIENVFLEHCAVELIWDRGEMQSF